MDNQHKKIKGYRDLSQDEIDAMNDIKEMGIQLEALVQNMPHNSDKRWQSIGVTDLQKGLMALTRSIAKPEFF